MCDACHREREGKNKNNNHKQSCRKIRVEFLQLHCFPLGWSHGGHAAERVRQFAGDGTRGVGVRSLDEHGGMWMSPCLQPFGQGRNARHPRCMSSHRRAVTWGRMFKGGQLSQVLRGWSVYDTVYCWWGTSHTSGQVPSVPVSIYASFRVSHRDL